jgi:hypothetical protein
MVQEDNDYVWGIFAGFVGHLVQDLIACGCEETRSR